MAAIIIVFILLIPVYGFLIWSYLCPEESFMLGKRGMFKEAPEPSEGAIHYTKFASLISLIIITFLIVFSIIAQF